MRLNKYISDTGFCSRREADRLIQERRVTINGKPAVIGVQVGDDDEVRVNGQIVRAKTRGGHKVKVYIALNKPVGVTCTTERHVRGNIVDFVDHQERVFPIGRLDKDSEGLILLTNDGDIVNRVLRAENNHEKEYLVGVDRAVGEDFLAAMARGVNIGEATTLPCKVTRLSKFGFRIVLTQGLNRQIRRMCETLGFQVQSLQRVRIMNIRLERLKLGQWRNLTPAELKGLLPEPHKNPASPQRPSTL